MVNKNNYLSFVIPEELKQQIKKIQDNILLLDNKFKPMPLDALHITISFYGENMNRFNKIEIDKFFDDIDDCTNWKSEIKLHSPIITNFPPGKDNLYIIKYNINQAGSNFVTNINDRFRHLLVIQDKEDWIPHITIGKMRDVNKYQYMDNNLGDFHPTEIRLCGTRYDDKTWKLSEFDR